MITLRHPHPHELPALYNLLNRCFRPQGGHMEYCFPHFLAAPHPFSRLDEVKEPLSHLWIALDGERIVGHVGVQEALWCLDGESLRVGCIGAVCTDEEARGQGIATKLLEAAQEAARKQGIDLFMISGTRGLYTRQGGVPCGMIYRLILTPQNPPQNPSENPSQNPPQNPSQNPLKTLPKNPPQNPSQNPPQNPSQNPPQNPKNSQSETNQASAQHPISANLSSGSTLVLKNTPSSANTGVKGASLPCGVWGGTPPTKTPNHIKLLRSYNSGDLRDVQALWRGRGVRFEREDELAAFLLVGGYTPWMREARHEVYVYERVGEVVAFLVIWQRSVYGEVMEYAGDVEAITEALELALERHPCLHVSVPWQEEGLLEGILPLASSCEKRPNDGVISILRWPAMVGLLKKRLAASLRDVGWVEEIEAREDEQGFVLSVGGASLRWRERADLAGLFFGHPPEPSDAMALLPTPVFFGAEASLIWEALQRVLPLPRPCYGLHYI